MFDNLRDLPDDTPLYEDNQGQDDLLKDKAAESSVAAPARKKRKSKNFLGMTAQQRFLISIMLMFTVCLLGMLVMFVMGRMSIL